MNEVNEINALMGNQQSTAELMTNNASQMQMLENNSDRRYSGMSIKPSNNLASGVRN